MSSNLPTSSSTDITNQNDQVSQANLRTPSDRDLEIYKHVKIQRVPQYEVAVDNDLHYSRVSQIVKDVHQWLIAGGQPSDPELRDYAARQRLSRAAHQLRLLRCLELATDYMEARPAQFESTRRRLVHGQEQWREETKRDPQSQSRLAAIRLVLRTTEALHKLEQTEPKASHPAPAADQDLLPAIFELLCTWRNRAQAAGLKDAAPDVSSLVATTLNNLLGSELPSEIRGRESFAQTTSPSPQTDAANDSRPLSVDSTSPIQPSITGTSNAATPLNFSAPAPKVADTTTDDIAPCAESIITAQEEKLQLERTTPPETTNETDLESQPARSRLTAVARCVLFLLAPVALAFGRRPQLAPATPHKSVSSQQLSPDDWKPVAIARSTECLRGPFALVNNSKLTQSPTPQPRRIEATFAARKLPAAHQPCFRPLTSTEGSMNVAGSLALLALFAAPGDSVLLQFSSQRCQHCQAMQPLVAQLAQQGVQVQVVDVDQQPDLARQFKLKGVPTFVSLNGGQETGRIEGATTLDKLAALTTKAATSGRGSPDTQLPPDQTALAATVRLKVEDTTGYGFGTGTIIDIHDSEALVVTCGHLFRESKGQGKVTADLFASGAPQSVDGQLIAYDLDRDIALVSLRAPSSLRAVPVAPPGHTVRPGDRAFTIGCDKGADPSVRPTHITAVNKYRGRPNFTAAGQPIDGRSGGGLFSAEGHLIGICNAADPADDEGLYAGLASIHWQLDQIGQSEIYQRSTRVASAAPPPRDTSVALAASQSPAAAVAPVPQLPPQMPAGPLNAQPTSARDVVPVAGDDTEIVFIVRSKRDPAQRSEMYLIDGAPPDLVARITHAAQASGQQRAALARSAAQPPARTASTNHLPGTPPVVRGQSAEY